MIGLRPPLTSTEEPLMLVSTQVRRGRTPLVLALLTAAGCAEPATAPVPGLGPSATVTPLEATAPVKARNVKAHKTYDRDSKNTIYTFTIDPRAAQVVKLGDHKV